MTAQEYVDKIIGITEQKRECMQKMYQLTQRQSQILTVEGVDALDDLIEKKQTCIDMVNKLDDAFEIYAGRLKMECRVMQLSDLSPAMGLRHLERLQAVTGEVLRLIRATYQLEQQNSKQAAEVLDEISGEIRKINHGKAAQQAYLPGKKTNSGAYFIDKRN